MDETDVSTVLFADRGSPRLSLVTGGVSIVGDSGNFLCWIC